MNDKEFWVELAKKLTAILAFTVLIVIIIALLGERIPAGYQVLIYIVVIGGMLIFVLQTTLSARAEYKQAAGETPKAEQLVSQPEPLAPQQEPQPSPEPATVLSKDEARQAYLQTVIYDNRPLRLAGMDEHAGDPNSVRLSLEEIYIDLDTTTQVEQEKSQQKRQKGKADEQAEMEQMLDRESKSRPLSVIEALLQSTGHRMVLLGFPGTGKSTFVRYLALMMAQELSGEPRRIQGWDGKPLLPVAISLGRFAESLPKDIQKGQTEHLEKFLKTSLEADKRTAVFAPYLLETLKQDSALFLLDGLDEVANLALRPIVVEAVENFADAYGRANSKSIFLVTCRTYSYQDQRWQLTQWPQHELALLTDEQIQRFVTSWYDQHTLLDQKRAIEYGEKKQKLMAALQPDDRRRLSEVARFPIILTVMAVVHASYELPDSRAQVYKQCVDLLLEKWNAKRAIMGQEQTRNILAELNVPRARIDQALYEIAFEAHRGRNDDDASGGLVTEKLVSGVMTEYLQDSEKVGVFLDYCQKANGLLMLQGTVTSPGSNAMPRRVYTFPHLTFEEYLAGRYLDGQGGEIVRQLLDQAHDRWREVTKLLAEYLCFESADRARMNDILEALTTPFPPEPADEDWRALWLAGELLVLYKRAFPKAYRDEGEIITNLRKLLEAAALAPRERAAAADILDELGYLPADLYEFVPIPDSQSPNYLIARYPVTNAQYRRFVEAEDFAAREYWIDFPKFAEPEKNYVQMGDWGDEGWQWLQKNWDEDKKKYPRYWDDVRFGIARLGVPVVEITWYEANAYCKWLLAHWDDLAEGEQNSDLKPEILRLPTETEWIIAAGGLPSPVGRGAGGEGPDRFPWDKAGEITQEKAEILRRANVVESNIGRTTPVGMYPLGVSPTGVWDMGGNVWEWQANCYNNSHQTLAWRGGSWNYNSYHVRLSRRSSSRPSYNWNYYGFRVVALPSGRF